VLGFLVVAVGSLATAHAEAIPVKNGLTELRPLLGLLLVFPLLSAVRDVRSVELGLWIILAASCIAAFEILLYYLQGKGEGAVYTEGALRVTGLTFLYPLLATVWALVLVAFPASTRTRLLLFAIAALSAGSLLVTFQRSAWLAALAAVPISLVLMRSGGRGRAAARALPVVAAAALLFVTFNTFSVAGTEDPLQATADRFASIGQLEADLSSQHRVNEWTEAIDRIRAAPLTGIGLGGDITFWSPLYQESTGRVGGFITTAYIHNSYIWLALKTGMLGALLFVLLVGILAAIAFRESKRERDPRRQRLLVGALTTLGAMILLAVTGPHLHLAPSVAYLAALMAGVEGLRRLRSSERAAAASAG
jgi:O-antigen ligase